MDAGEDAGDAARREFMEELGSAPVGPLQPLGEIRQRGGKRVHAFAVNGDLDVQTVASNTFEMESPPKSGRMQTVPEVERAEWITLPIARTKILEGQRPLLDRLEQLATTN
jgi:predicted NUDIX family NTP pyrophosphohydrolase